MTVVLVTLAISQAWLQTMGRAHVAVVHFPIALLMLAGIVESWRALRRKEGFSSFSLACLVLGAVGAIVAAAFGWLHASFSTFGGQTASVMRTHQWLGIATAAIAVIALLAGAAKKFGGDKAFNVYRFGTIACAALVGITGHLGGSVTHGVGYLTELITDPTHQLASNSPTKIVEVHYPADGKIEFEKHVQPILAQSCYDCHGPSNRKGQLRLDSKPAALAGGNSGPSIIAGKSGDSPLIKRVLGLGNQKRMPLDHPPLPDEQIKILTEWVDKGAVWPDHASFEGGQEAKHWAYVKPTKPNVPAVNGQAWPRNPIDNFVLAKLEKENLAPSKEADRATLIRRLSLDLLGLPPKPAEVDAFIADDSVNAYEKLVDRLLASPQYGERMAVYWFDLVRFADTNGLHSDVGQAIDPFRDYVIDAFNKNEPFDQFTIEQLAGDLLEKPTTEQKIASGYNRLILTTEEGGAQPKEYFAKYATDRVRNVGSVWLGGTIGCAECHNHKFDPYTAKDFYAMQAFFADVKENRPGGRSNFIAEMPLPTTQQSAELKTLEDSIANANKTLATHTPELAAAQEKWEASTGATVWEPVEVIGMRSADGASLTSLPDGSILVSGTSPAKDTYHLKTRSPLKRITGVRLEVLPDISLPSNGPGRVGNFVLTAFKASAGPATAPSKPPTTQPRVEFISAQADYSQPDFGVANVLDAKAKTGWGVMPEFGKPHYAVFETKEDIAFAEGANLNFMLEQRSTFAQHNIGRFRISVTPSTRPVRAINLPPNINAILAIARDKRDENQKNELAAYFRTIAPALDPVRAQVAADTKKRDELNNSLRKMKIAEIDPQKPRISRILPRGNWLDDTGEIVTPAVPHFLPQIDAKGKSPSRLDLAQWIVSKDNPLTARVFVNRVWRMFYGIGISKSLDDLGTQGEKPVNPELLDWLACEFMDSGWDVKHVVKLMVTSSAYRQSSAGDKQLRERDPFNRLIARQSRFRLDAEFVRDNALAISGLISLKMGGPSVKPYQPPGYYDFLNFPKRTYENDHGEDAHRRGVYTWWQRTFLHPTFLAFDATPREECVAERPRSNTPLQSLSLLNDPIFVEAARVFAERIIKEGGSTNPDRLTWAYRTALSRTPKPQETQVLTKLLEKHLAEYIADKKSAEALLTVGEAPVAKDIDPPQLAAWTSVARVIFNTNEVITRN